MLGQVGPRDAFCLEFDKCISARVLRTAVPESCPCAEALPACLCRPSQPLQPLILGLSVALPLQEGPDSGRDRCCELEHAASSGRLLSLSSMCGEFPCVFLWPDSSFLFYHCCAFFCTELKYKHQNLTVTACEPLVRWR